MLINIMKMLIFHLIKHYLRGHLRSNNVIFMFKRLFMPDIFFVYSPILSKLYMNANIIKTHFLFVKRSWSQRSLTVIYLATFMLKSISSLSSLSLFLNYKLRGHWRSKCLLFIFVLFKIVSKPIVTKEI